MNALDLLTRFGVAKAAAGGGGGTPTYLLKNVPSLVGLSTNNQIGWQFTANVDFSLTGLRVYVATGSGEETLRLWRVSDATLLASVAVTSAASAWVEGNFGTPVPLSNGSDYLITARRTSGASRGMWRGSPGAFTFDPNVTYVTGRFGASDAFPTTTAANVYGIIDGIYEA